MSDPNALAVQVLTEHRSSRTPGQDEYTCVARGCGWLVERDDAETRVEFVTRMQVAFARHLVEQLAAAGVPPMPPVYETEAELAAEVARLRAEVESYRPVGWATIARDACWEQDHPKDGPAPPEVVVWNGPLAWFEEDDAEDRARSCAEAGGWEARQVFVRDVPQPVVREVAPGVWPPRPDVDGPVTWTSGGGDS